MKLFPIHPSYPHRSSASFPPILLSYFQLHGSRSLFGHHECFAACNTHERITTALTTRRFVYRFHMDLHLVLVASSYSFSHGSFLFYCRTVCPYHLSTHPDTSCISSSFVRVQFYLRLTAQQTAQTFFFHPAFFFYLIVTLDAIVDAKQDHTVHSLHSHSLRHHRFIIIWSSAPLHTELAAHICCYCYFCCVNRIFVRCDVRCSHSEWETCVLCAHQIFIWRKVIRIRHTHIDTHTQMSCENANAENWKNE